MAVTPDGSPVDVYLRLPPHGEAELVHAAIPAGAEVLELGCGVGRITRELIRLGHPVVAVDESPEMLAHVRGAETVLARIEELELGRRFPCVLLASHFVNVDEDERRMYLDTCARHVGDDGIVVIQRYDPAWAPDEGAATQLGDVTITMRDVKRGDRRIAAAAEYTLDGRTWTQPFTAVLLDDDALDATLRDAGLFLARALDERGLWVEARRS